MSETGVTFHHPRCDIKKVSEWEKKSSLLAYWEVKYLRGGIQPGSSGSPLFNSSGYLVGQLSQGSTKPPCDDKFWAWYGRFDKSWHKFDLCYELNPNGTHSGNHKYFIVSTPGEETCKENWNFNSCNDLHTSDNVTFLDSSPGTRQYDGVYNAKNQVTAENTIIQIGTTVVFEAGNNIVLKSGFHAKGGSTFTAKIGDCELGCNNGKRTGENDYKTVIYNSNDTDIVETRINTAILENNENMQEFIIYPNPNYGVFLIKLSNENSDLQKIMITDAKGTIIYNNMDANIVNNKIHLPNPVAGIYFISLYFADKIITSKFTIL
jgi:hypothetical protein